MGKLLVFVSPHGEFFNIKTDFPREEQKSFDRFGVLLEDAKTIPNQRGVEPGRDQRAPSNLSPVVPDVLDTRFGSILTITKLETQVYRLIMHLLHSKRFDFFQIKPRLYCSRCVPNFPASFYVRDLTAMNLVSQPFDARARMAIRKQDE